MVELLLPRERLQFSMRLLLLVTAVFGVGLGLLVYRKATNGHVTIEQVSRVKLDMTEYQVISVLGAPLHRFENVLSLRWTLDDPSMQSQSVRDSCFLDIAFDHRGRVVKIDELGRFQVRMVRPAPAGSTQAKPAPQQAPPQ